MKTKLQKNKILSKSNLKKDLRLTQAMENYLLSIYVVMERLQRVSNSDLIDQLRRVPASENLGTSLPSVSGMLKRMEKEELIYSNENRDILLTDIGNKLAESLIRKHRIVSRMIVDLLGVDLNRVNAESHMLEHALSDELEIDIISKLNNPKIDPFGQPIPGSGYKIPKSLITINLAPLNTLMVVHRIPEDDSDLVKFLCDNNILPGSQITVKEIAEYRGVVTVEIKDKKVTLGLEVSKLIYLCDKCICGEICLKIKN